MTQFESTSMIVTRRVGTQQSKHLIGRDSVRPSFHPRNWGNNKLGIYTLFSFLVHFLKNGDPKLSKSKPEPDIFSCSTAAMFFGGC